jgi:C4-dicarboxylate transporter
MKKRDEKGRYILDDIEKGVNIFYLIYKMIPIIIVLFILWKYIGISSKLESLLMELLCGSSSCQCTFKSKFDKNGGGNDF